VRLFFAFAYKGSFPAMITVSQFFESYGTRPLFDNVSVKFTPGNHYGLTEPTTKNQS
jgi:hypothetical protein